jgi:hypothetical protein
MTNENHSPTGDGTAPIQPEIVSTGPGAPAVTVGPPALPALVGADDGNAAEGTADEAGVKADRIESIEQPAKLLRIGSMVKQLLEEVRQAPLDEASRGRLREIYEQSVRELADGLSPDLSAELDRVSIPFDSPTPSDSELRIAHAQLVGWLEGLFHGIQATLVAQQMAARSQLDEMRQQALPRGGPAGEGRPGTYL